MSRRREAVRKALDWIEREQAVEHHEPLPGEPKGTHQRPWIKDWQTAWAQSTLNVIDMVWRAAGERIYRSRGELYDDLRGWLVVQAQVLANRYQPRWHTNDPEDAWRGYLWRSLNEASRWHFASTIGPKNEANHQAHSDMANRDARIEAMIHRAGPAQEMRVVGSFRPAFSWTPLSPEAHVLLMESILERMYGPAPEPEAPTHTCVEDGCAKQADAPRGYCQAHYTQHLTMWSTNPRCKTPSCPDAGIQRGYCPKHYKAEYRRRQQAGSPWEPVTHPDTCTTPGCTEPFYSNDMCKSHAAKAHRETKPPCTADGCTTRQNSRGLCSTHYKQLRAREKGQAA